MPAFTGNYGVATPLSASGVVAAQPCAVIGFICATSTSGTISLFDNASAASGTNFVLPTPVTAGQFLPISIATALGCYAVLTNATGTFVWDR